MDCIPRVAGKRCGTSQARASMLASGGQPTEVFHSLSRSSHHRDPARQAVQEWGRGSEQGFRASTFAAPRDEHVPPAGLGCRRRCVGRQWKPRPRKLWQTSCRAQVGIPMAPPGLPLGRWIMAGGPPGRGSVLPRLCGATMKRRVELPVAITSRPVVGEYIQTCCRRIHPDHPVYYISRRACGHDDADDSSRRLATTWDPHIYQTTLYIIFVDDQHESGSFSPGDLGLPSAPGFSAIHQPTGDQPVGAGRGTCEGRCWGSTPRFSSFLCARLRTTFRRAQPRIASVLRHRRGSTTIHQRPGQ
jgi:hypothetical protein